MAQFYREYPEFGAFLSQPVAETRDTASNANLLITQKNFMQPLVAQLPWIHNVLLIQKIKDLKIRAWYMEQIITQGWSRSVLETMLNAKVYQRQGKSVTNFKTHLPSYQSELAQQTLKDPYIFDFLTLEEPFHERELEVGLIEHLQKFLLELGQGFSFVGRQFHIDLGGEDFYIDLLFYHLKLRAFVVIELKKGKFKPEYAGKLNFYLSVVDRHLKHESDQPTIGLILCQNKNKIIAEYSLQAIQRPIGISEYQITRALPTELKSSLPTIEEIESELEHHSKPKKKKK
jgi:predicted nuclease of restriction endonuclease-like (RecB) superfamily